jgi:ubiquinol-cytochrome c reductase cytochrome c subunit
MTAPLSRLARLRQSATWQRMPRRPSGPRSPLRRRITTAVRLGSALLFVGGLYAAFAPGTAAATAADGQTLSAQAQEGKVLFDSTCITCHGRNAQGVPEQGPSLIGVGSAAVEFQVATGRMPASGQGAQIVRRDPAYTRDQAKQIGAYIQELGGGPQLPDETDAQLADGDVARGGTLFRVNCSSCHAFGAGGGALSSGKSAPSLEQATPRDIWAAMLTGPQNMPVFGNNQLTPAEKRDIVAYIQNLQHDQDPGGWGIGRLGPVSEGLAIFLVGVVALVFTALWIAGKS